jgi:hypothetical protein
MPLDTTLERDAERRNAIRRDVERELQMKPVEVSGRHRPILANRRRASGRQFLWRRKTFCAGERQDVAEHDAGKPTSSITNVTTPQKYVIFYADEPKVIELDAGKPTSSITTVTTSQKYIIFYADEPKVIEHDVVKPTPDGATPPKDRIFGTCTSGLHRTQETRCQCHYAERRVVDNG